MDDESRLIATVEKNPGERIHISTSFFKGREYVDVRLFYKDDAGIYRATKKGLTFSLALLPEVLEALEKVAEKAGMEVGA